MNKGISLAGVIAVSAAAVLFFTAGSFAQNEVNAPVMPSLTGQNSSTPNNVMPNVGELMKFVEKATTDGQDAKDFATPVKMVIIFAGLAILPSLLVMMTSFTRIVIVLSFVRRALSTQTIPPNIAIMGLALFLTMFTMAPTFSKINSDSIQPYLENKITFQVASDAALAHIKAFMLRQIRPSDLAVFTNMAQTAPVSDASELGMQVVVPAFAISEFRTAFEIGCLLFIPFLLIDIVIASILLSAGMMMLPPVMISLPLKLILFILVDGWGLLARSLSLSFK
ncbi:MAG: flagellar type III secretion system pore protein FliP [Phycisphaerae bacterium]|nr:flagellar type III secretion system pore protein FliP [Phycisphaerae bacterium]